MSRGLKTFYFFCSAFLLCSNSAYADAKVEQKYMNALDEWIAEGANPEHIQDKVVTPCGKFIMLKYPTLSISDRDEFDIMVDICVKLTVQRRYPQPEFEKEATIQLICRDNKELFGKMCVKANLVEKN